MFESAWRLAHRSDNGYAQAMTVLSAHDVAAELRRRLQGLGVKKQHKLLYYCQGHHLATFGEPLFSETISAWDMGPVVGELWYAEKNGQVPSAPGEPLSEAQLNTIGYVISRYGALTGADLERLTHNESPWCEANKNRLPGSAARIPIEALRAFFVTPQGADDDTDALLLDTDDVAAWLGQVKGVPADAPAFDSLAEIRARLVRG